MFADDANLAQGVRLWVDKAENDLMTAKLLLKAKGPADTICFHAQQCVEKYLKALLAWRRIDFSRTHHLEALMTLLPVRDRPDLSGPEQIQLTAYATETRYPGDYEPITFPQARQAMQIAQRIRKQIRSRLPKEAQRK